MASEPTVTVTATCGPAQAMAAVPFARCREVKFEFDRNVAFVTDGDGKVHEYALDAAVGLVTAIVATKFTTLTQT